MEYKHFSHHHPLTLSRADARHQIRCHGCHLPCNDSILACWNCNFFLHNHCGNANRHVNHPSHTLHPLVLMPSPTYCSGSFQCDACGFSGSSFSYSCALCEVDLHVNCAYLPPKLSHGAHQHEIFLSFGNTEGLSYSNHCRLCRKEVGFRNWSYLCDRPGCDFQVHTFCATNELTPGVYQDVQPGQTPVNETPGQNTSVDQPQARTEDDLTPEQAAMLEISRMNMELGLTIALGNIIASK